MGRDALIAIYFPLAIYAGLASILYCKGVLIPAISRRELSIREHGLAICIVIGLGMDFVETTYYGAARLIPEIHSKMHAAILPIISMRLFVLATSIIALTSYFYIVGHKWRLAHVMLGAVFLWAVAFLWISTR